MLKPPERRRSGLLAGGGAVRWTWLAAGVCGVLLAGAIAWKEADRAGGCAGTPRAAADAFAADLTARGRTAAAGHLARSALGLARTFPVAGGATPVEVRRMLAGGRRNAGTCALFQAVGPIALRMTDHAEEPCFAYDLPARLAAGTPPGFAVTLSCERGRWRIDGFL